MKSFAIDAAAKVAEKATKGTSGTSSKNSERSAPPGVEHKSKARGMKPTPKKGGDDDDTNIL